MTVLKIFHVCNIWTRYKSFSYNGRWFIITLILQAIFITGIQLAIVFEGNFSAFALGTDRLVFVFLFIISIFYFLLFAVDALVSGNSWQMVALIPLEVLYTIYAVLQVNSFQQLNTSGGLTSIKISVILCWIGFGIMLLFTLLIAYQTRRIYPEFGWLIYRNIGASKNIRKMFYSFILFDMFVKVTVLFVFVFLLQMVTTLLRTNDPEFFLSIIALPLIFVFVYFLDYSTRNEVSKLFIPLLLIFIPGLCYFVFKFYRFYTQSCPVCKDLVSSNPSKSFLFLEVNCTVNFLFLLSSFICGCICWHNFGHGLKERLVGFGQDIHSETVDALGEDPYVLNTSSSSRNPTPALELSSIDIKASHAGGDAGNLNITSSTLESVSSAGWDLERNPKNPVSADTSSVGAFRDAADSETSTRSRMNLPGLSGSRDAMGGRNDAYLSNLILSPAQKEILRLSNSELVLAMIQKETQHELEKSRQREISCNSSALNTSDPSISADSALEGVSLRKEDETYKKPMFSISASDRAAADAGSFCTSQKSSLSNISSFLDDVEEYYAAGNEEELEEEDQDRK